MPDSLASVCITTCALAEILKEQKGLNSGLVSLHGPVCSPFGNGPNTVSESTVSNTELSEVFGPHRVLGRDLSEFLSGYYLCAEANSPSLSRNSPSLP